MTTFFDWLFSSQASFDVPSVPCHLTGPPILLLALVAGSAWWAARDATRRGKSAPLAFVFVLFAGWPLSLLFWRWLRPALLPGTVHPPSPPPNNALQRTEAGGGVSSEFGA